MLCLLSSLLVASSLVFIASCCAGFKRSSSVIGRLETVRTISGQSSGEVEVKCQSCEVTECKRDPASSASEAKQSGSVHHDDMARGF